MAIYVSAVAGSDSNPGTQAAPKRTVQAGVNACASGDTLVVSPDGVYNEAVSLGGSRTGLWMVSAHPDAKPVLDGGLAVRPDREQRQ